MHKFLFCNKFILFLYMFRALFCSSSGGQNYIIQHLVSSHSVGVRPVRRLRENSQPVRRTAMFRALLCSSSGGQNCIIQHLVSSHTVGGRPVRRLRENSQPVLWTAMFRALLCSSSGGENCNIQHLVSSHTVGGCPVHRTATYSVWCYKMMYITFFTFWWWAQHCSKHTDEYNKRIIKHESAH